MFLHWGGGLINLDLLTLAPVSLVVGLIDLVSLGGGHEVTFLAAHTALPLLTTSAP